MNGCPPVIDCQPDPPGGLAKSHAFAEGAARCDCGMLLNVDDHAAIVQAARALVEAMPHVEHAVRPDGLLARAKLLADLLPTPQVGS